MNLTLRKSNRKQAKIKLALQGASGSGKTYSALLLAKGMTDDWSKVAVIDTENGSADLYADLGQYNVLPLHHPYSPEMYIKAIDVCVENGIEVLIIDSLSHCWEYLLDEHSKMAGNSFTNWSKITPRLNALIQAILNAPIHVIATLRTKQDYVLSTKNGKVVPEKVGLKAIQRDGVDYEFTIVLEINAKHQATTSKDRTGLFVNLPAFSITEQTGARIKTWCERASASTDKSFSERINETKTVAELLEIYNAHPECRLEFKDAFIVQKARLTNPQSFSKEGSVTNG